MKKLEILSQRVSKLEKLILQLAKWTKFDSTKFGEAADNYDDEDDRNDEYLLRPEIETQRPIHRGIKGPKPTARKSTSASGGGQRSREVRAPNRGVKSSRMVSTPSSRKNGVVVDIGGLDLDVHVDIKTEPNYSGDDDDNYLSHYPEDNLIVGNVYYPENDVDANEKDHNLCNIGDSDCDSDYQIQPGGSDFDSSSSEDDDHYNAKLSTKNKSSAYNKGRGKQTLLHAGRPRYRKFAPLRISDTVANDPNPIIKLDNLSREELERMDVVIPKRRRFRQRGPHPCPHCDQSFAKKKQWDEHQKTHPKERKNKQKQAIHQCPDCFKIFVSNSKLVEHIRTHTGEKPYLCFRCGYAARCLGMLDSHIRSCHPDTPREKQFKCDKCDKAFYKNCELCSHTKVEHGENGRNELAVQCHLCGLVVIDKRRLTLHIRDVHENKRNFSCHLCGQMFKRSSHLKQHIIRHDNPNMRKRGPQKPLIRAKLVPQPDAIDNPDEFMMILQPEQPNVGNLTPPPISMGTSFDHDMQI